LGKNISGETQKEVLEQLKERYQGEVAPSLGQPGSGRVCDENR